MMMLMLYRYVVYKYHETQYELCTSIRVCMAWSVRRLNANVFVPEFAAYRWSQQEFNDHSDVMRIYFVFDQW